MSFPYSPGVPEIKTFDGGGDQGGQVTVDPFLQLSAMMSHSSSPIECLDAQVPADCTAYQSATACLGAIGYRARVSVLLLSEDDDSPHHSCKTVCSVQIRILDCYCTPSVSSSRLLVYIDSSAHSAHLHTACHCSQDAYPVDSYVYVAYREGSGNNRG